VLRKTRWVPEGAPEAAEPGPGCRAGLDVHAVAMSTAVSAAASEAVFLVPGGIVTSEVVMDDPVLSPGPG